MPIFEHHANKSKLFIEQQEKDIYPKKIALPQQSTINSKTLSKRYLLYTGETLFPFSEGTCFAGKQRRVLKRCKLARRRFGPQTQWGPLRKTLINGLGLDDMSLAWPVVVQLLVFIYSDTQLNYP